MKVGLAAMVGGMAALAAAAAPARAAGPATAPPGFEPLPVAAQSLAPEPSNSPLSLAPAPRRTLQLDSKGRWGFRLDMEQPTARDQDFRDVQAGAYYRFGRSLRVGGSLGFGPSPSPANLRPQDDAGPRVRLESNFKF